MWSCGKYKQNESSILYSKLHSRNLEIYILWHRPSITIIVWMPDSHMLHTSTWDLSENEKNVRFISLIKLPSRFVFDILNHFESSASPQISLNIFTSFLFHSPQSSDVRQLNLWESVEYIFENVSFGVFPYWQKRHWKLNKISSDSREWGNIFYYFFWSQHEYSFVKRI